MKNKKIIIGSMLVICAILVGATLAWFTWSTTNEQNTNVVVTIGGATISYEDGDDITNNNLIPTSTKEQGISKDITISSTSTVYLDLNMTVVTLDDGLKDASFKYGLYDSADSPVVEGNFASSNVGDTINLLDGVTITSTPVTYTLYIWIDGNMSNPNTMYNQNFEFRLNANATDERPIQTITGVELGEQIALLSNGVKDIVDDVATTDEGIWETQDDYGTSYYFRGAATNNYVKFAGYYWRIIRINGDGSIRMIYDGTSAHANGESSDDRQIGTSAYNENYDDNAYVGYMYGQTGASSYSATHANTNDSTIKTVLDNWYKTNIEDKGYSDKVADVIYCNDRRVYTESSWSGYGTLGYGANATTYGSASKVLTWQNGIVSWKNIQEINMICSQKNDAFTVNDTNRGNGSLSYPIGLLTLDESLAAGGLGGLSNGNYFLYTDNFFWTMTATYYNGSDARNFIVVPHGFHENNVSAINGVRPVVSLKSSVELTGNGTMDSPYVVQ